ncbi:MAG: DUF3253 domain-containing protein [Alphaproteobacteria bacterium]
MSDDTQDQLDPVAEAILTVLEAAPDNKAQPKAVAEYLANARRTKKDPPDLWRRYMMAVRQQAKFLARSGVIEILRKGKPVDPHAPIKGLVVLRLTQTD